MEKRIGTITILVTDRTVTRSVNEVLSQYAEVIVARQGIPFHTRPVAVISLIVEGGMDQINALSGKLGRLGGVEAKLVVAKTA